MDERGQERPVGDEAPSGPWKDVAGVIGLDLLAVALYAALALPLADAPGRRCCRSAELGGGAAALERSAIVARSAWL